MDASLRKDGPRPVHRRLEGPSLGRTSLYCSPGCRPRPRHPRAPAPYHCTLGVFITVPHKGGTSAWRTARHSAHHGLPQDFAGADTGRPCPLLPLSSLRSIGFLIPSHRESRPMLPLARGRKRRVGLDDADSLASVYSIWTGCYPSELSRQDARSALCRAH